MTITFMGMPASGKSCMGRALSKVLHKKFLDGDWLIEKVEGEKLQDIINSRGLEEFKNVERRTLLSIKGNNLIISPGGSAVYYPEVMEYFKSLGPVVYLYCTPEVIIERLGDFSKRGVVLRPGQTIEDLYEERHALYSKYADIVVDCSGRDYRRYQERVIAAIRQYEKYRLRKR